MLNVRVVVRRARGAGAATCAIMAAALRSRGFSSFPTDFMLIALIHNNEPDRLPQLRQSFLDIIGRVGGDVIEVFEQPKFEPLDYFSTVKRLAIYGLVHQRWAAFQQGRRHGSDSLTLRDWWRVFRHGLNAFKAASNKKLRRQLAIEPILGAKHVAAWKRLTETNETYLLVAESDVLGQPHSADRLLAIRSQLPADGRPIYVDLAGGLPHDLIGVDKIIEDRKEGVLVLNRPATNTTCSYVISRSLADSFLKMIAERPYFRDVASDWLVNCLMMSAAGEGQMECWHAHPTVFDHGSLTGEYRSVIR
jgi:hypothetical protein